MTQKPMVISIGEVLWDLLPSGKQAGGAPTNFVYHAIQAGADGHAISAIGRDQLGEELAAQVQAHHINALLQRNDYPTGTVEVSLVEGIPQYSITRDVAWDHLRPSAEAIELAKRADAISFGSLALREPESRQTILGLLDQAKADSLRYFDINIRQDYYSTELIEALLARATVFKLNDEELALLTPLLGLPTGEEAACASLLERYRLDYVILTAGADHSRVVGHGQASLLPTPKVEVADTVSAGDSFSGAFTTALLSGASLAQAHRRAVNVAAFVCTQAGAWPEYPEQIPDYCGR